MVVLKKSYRERKEVKIPGGILADFLGKAQTAEEFPLLPLKDIVIFPQTMMSVYITYKSGIAALEEAIKRGLKLFAVCIKDSETGELYDAGTVVRVVQNLRLPDNTFRVVFQGEYRATFAAQRGKISKIGSTLVRVEPITAPAPSDIKDSDSMQDVT